MSFRRDLNWLLKGNPKSIKLYAYRLFGVPTRREQVIDWWRYVRWYYRPFMMVDRQISWNLAFWFPTLVILFMVDFALILVSMAVMP